jgi:hypothetical protein
LDIDHGDNPMAIVDVDGDDDAINDANTICR